MHGYLSWLVHHFLLENYLSFPAFEAPKTESAVLAESAHPLVDGWRVNRHDILLADMSSSPKLLQLLFSFLTIERVFIDDIQLLALFF